LSLHVVYRWFDRRCRSYEKKVNELYLNKSSYHDWEFRFLSESLLSEIWQSWCLFSRILLLKSLRGCNTRNGCSINARVGDNSWNRICYEASNAFRGRAITSTAHQSFKMRHELTWGDPNVFIRTVQHFSPPNKAALLSAYGMPLDGIKHLQKVRNSCAHKNIENIIELRALNSIYNFSSIGSPVDVIWSTKRGTNTLAIEQWLYEVNLVADFSAASL